MSLAIKQKKIEFNLLDHQAEFVNDQSRYLLNSGGAGAGKTFSIILKTLALIISFPGIFILIGAQTYPLLRDTTLREFLNIVPAEMIKFYNKSTLHFVFFNGSEVIFRAFNDETKLKSLNLGACGIEEMTDVSEEIFKMVRTRMRQPKMPGCVYGATNPNTFGNWVYKYFIETPIIGSNVIYSKSSDNDYLPKEYLDDLETMKITNPEYYNRMVAGIWGQMEGLVYTLPVEQRIKIEGAEYQRYIAGLDFGYTHPTAFVVIGINEDENHIIDEIYRHKLTSADIIDAIKEKMERYNIDAIYCDTARPEIIEDMKRAGLPARESIKDVFDGIMWVKSLIGKKKLFVSSDCVYTLREFDSYIWDSGSEVKEIPIKINDDCMDALRYALYSDRAKISATIRWV